jgi:hypothetical protein
MPFTSISDRFRSLTHFDGGGIPLGVLFYDLPIPDRLGPDRIDEPGGALILSEGLPDGFGNTSSHAIRASRVQSNSARETLQPLLPTVRVRATETLLG